MIRIHNLETGEITDRDLTNEEIADNAERDEKLNQIITKEETKLAARRVLLEKLGITEEEAKLLLS